MNNNNLTGDAVTATLKASPPLAVSAMAVDGWSLQDWVLIATLTYTILLIAHLIYKFFRDLGREKPDVE